MPEPAASKTVIVVCGGDAPAPGARSLGELGEPDFVIAADSGVDTAQELGLPVDLAVGDFDSVTSAGLCRARSGGALVDAHPAAKDETDLDLALRCALGRRPERIVVIGGGGGRLDHLLANVSLLSAPALADVDVVAHLGDARADVIRPGAGVTLHGAPGDLVSLIPVHGPGDGCGHRRSALRAAPRDAAGGHQPRRQQRLRPGPRHRVDRDGRPGRRPTQPPAEGAADVIAELQCLPTPSGTGP